MSRGLNPSDRPRGRCWSCHRFASWRRVRYCWRSSCCHVEWTDDGRPAPVVAELLNEGTVAGVAFRVYVTRPDINPNTITRRQP